MKETIDIEANLSSLIEVAEEAARKAGTYLIQKLGSAKVEYQKAFRDDLLDADLEAEHLLLTTLREKAPHIGILSEEAGHEGQQEHYWIVDPLDGSANFQHGSPLFAVAIALVSNRATKGGIIYIPSRDEMFIAIQSKGAYLNGERIKVSERGKLDEAIVHIGDFAKGGDLETTKKRLKNVSKLAIQASRIRMLGTAATDLAYVACGRADMLVNHASKPWDIEAGKLLLLEAGGKATTKTYHDDLTVSIYSNGVIHQIAEDLLNEETES